MMVNLAVCVLVAGFWSIGVDIGTVRGDNPAKEPQLGGLGHLGRVVLNPKRDGENGRERRRAEPEGEEVHQGANRPKKFAPSASLILWELHRLKESVNDLKTQSNMLFKRLNALHKSCSASIVFSAALTTPSSLSSSSSPSALESTLYASDEIRSINNAIQSGKNQCTF